MPWLIRKNLVEYWIEKYRPLAPELLIYVTGDHMWGMTGPDQLQPWIAELKRLGKLSQGIDHAQINCDALGHKLYRGSDPYYCAPPTCPFSISANRF